MVPVQVFCFLLLSFFWVADAAKCPPSFNCGNLGNKIQFPFTSLNRRDCGLFIIHGCDDSEEPNAPKFIKYNEEWVDVLELDQFTITIRDDDLQKHLLSNSCSVFSYSLPSFTNSDFASYHIENNFTMFVCNRSLNLKPIESYFRTESLYYRFDNCSSSEEIIFYRKSPYYHEDDDDVVSRFLNSSCNTVQLPISKNSVVVDNPFAFLSENITINIQLTSQCDICHKVHGGQCQLDSHGSFHCAKVSAKARSGNTFGFGITLEKTLLQEAKPDPSNN
ncbi:hypothetical protein K1719_008827 [Acacia pycnantha]|nr:hypothetical protein K1719_008827 [Acacia pycnantha]